MARCVAVAALILLCAGAAPAQEDEAGGCVYDRKLYPEGYELCQDGTLERCEEGAWAAVGLCDPEAPPAPRAGGGDVETEPDE